jgi:spermidine synthase
VFEELATDETPMGVLHLRRRREPTLDVEVVEVKLGDEYLMSSLFTAGEIALAELGLAAVDGADLDVVVGGLGLGYTAAAVLRDPRVGRLTVVEALPQVIAWHRDGLLPEVGELADDPRVALRHADFFALAREPGALAPNTRDQRLDAVLVDIDHTPRHLLHASHADLYEEAGLRRLQAHLRPGGVFALWSDDPPDTDFVAVCRGVFDTVASHVVAFRNPLAGGEATNTVYVCR